MNELVRIITADDGSKKDNPDVWHLISPMNAQGSASFCEDEFFGSGESGCEFEVKYAKRGGITCRQCLDKIKVVKAIKL